MNFRIPKMAALLPSVAIALVSSVTILIFKFHGPITPDLTSVSSAMGSTSIFSVSSAASSGVSSMASSTVSSAASSGVSSATSSKTSSKSTSSKAAPKAVVPTKAQLQTAVKKVTTKAEKVAEDPEYNKNKVSAPIKDSVSVSSVASKVQSTKPASSAAGSAVSSAVSSVASSASSVYTGWTTINGSKYFYYQNSPLTEWQTIDGKKYYFDSKGVLKTRVGIDVSEYQGTIDWQKVKADGVDFAIIRAGWRGYGGGSYNKDAYFEQNYAGAKAAGIRVGIYFFSQAITVEEATAEAQFTLDILGGRSLSEPIVFDTEHIGDPDARTNTANLTNQQRTDFILAFCGKIKSAGYTPMLYSNLNWLYNYLDMSRLTSYPTWVAHYINDPSSGTSYKYPYKYWQYTSSGKIDGIYSSGLDMNISFS